MEVLISIVGSLATKAAEYTVDPIARQVSYLFKHESKFQNLKNQLQKLKDAREIVQHSVDEANRNAEQIFPCVNRWLTTVNEKISDQAATQLKEDEEKAKKRCFAELCPNFKSRYQLSKKMEKEVNTIAQLLNQKDEFNGRVSDRPAPKEIATRPVKDYKAFESRSGVLNGLMEALEDDNFNIIGVHGMGGVGKTTLVKEVARQAKEKQLLDEVVLVAVTQTPNTVNIQNEIAEKLGLKFDETSVDVRATRLRDRLKNANKVLVILDDIWVPLNLEELGIPSRDEHKGCKILMTSRNLDVLERMDSLKNLPIDVLKEDEPWKLFENMAGDIVERSDLKSTAIEVSQKCAGLPIAIATVAKALKHKENLFEWQNALEQLKRPTEVNIGGITSDVYSAIKLSYNFLENEEVKPTFLLCSIMGHNAAIEDLLRYCRGLGLFRGLNTIEKVRNKVLTLVSELKYSSLLLASFTPEYFDMHDVVCDVAISIASRDHQWLTLREEDVFEEWSDNETVRNFNAIILRYAKVSELPDELECPNLTFFSLGGQDSVLKFPTEDSSLKIPNNFFKQMQRLKVLNFAEMHFSSLPSSVGSLKTLCTLCFLGCVLEDIAIIGELKNLEILDLRRSTFAMLPEKIGQLTKLKLLDLSGCYSLEVISPNVLAGLSRLEELYLYDSFDRWDVKGHDNSRSNASLVELQHLSHLTTLEVHIPNEQALPKDNLFFEKLKRYKISIGDKWTWYEYYKMETSRMLKLKMNESIHLYEGVKKLLSETENLWLDDVKNVMDVLYDPNTEGLPHLKHLCVRNVSAMKLIACKEFPLLESLSLCNLVNLEAICYGQLKAGSFGQLRVIKVERCNVLKNLFSFSTARELRQLQEIEVVFPAIKELELRSLSSSEKLWDDQFPSAVMTFRFQNLSSLEVTSCHKLKYAFPSSIVKSFVQLKILFVRECEDMEEVIAVSAEEETNNIMVFPKLNSLQLGDLPNLKRFSCGINPIEFSILRELEIRNCPLPSTFYCDSSTSVGKNSSSISMDHNLQVDVSHCLFNDKVALPMLQRLSISFMENLERLWPNQLAEQSFPKLSHFYLESCDKLVNVFPSSMLTRLEGLEELIIKNCELVEEIFEPQQADGCTAIATFEFSRLTSLELTTLPRLKSFSHKMYAPNCPSLKEMEVRECQKVEILFGFRETDGAKSEHELVPIQQSLISVNKVGLPMLQSLSISSMKNLERLWPNKLAERSFSELSYFELTDCVKLVNVFPSSMLTRLERLEELIIKNCELVEEIFEPQQADGSTATAPFEFPRLTSLELTRLPRLKSFSHKMYAPNCPSLKEMEVRECHKVEILFGFRETDGAKSEHELVPIQQSLISVNKVALPMLKSLSISSMKNLERLWPNQLAEQSFPKLSYFDLRSCDKLVNVFPSSMLTRLERLEELIIRDCELVEEIFEPQQADGSTATAPFEFSRLTSLKLTRLPRLKSFSHKMYALNCPSLKEMEVRECHKVEILFGFRETDGAKSEHELVPIQQSLISVNKFTFPALQQLTLGWNDGMKEIWHCSAQQQQLLASHYFSKLKVVTLCGFPEQLAIFPSYLLQLLSFPNLETLEIREAYFKEIFPSDGVGEENPASAWVLLSRLTALRLDNLHELMHLWKEKEGFQNLRILNVERCPKLKNNLVPSTVSFKNLVTLEVARCDGIIKLVAYSTAKGLVQLKEMKIRSCENIEEITQGSGDDEDEAKDEISFPQLNLLVVIGLPKLESFCSSGNYTFGFPSLVTVILQNCPKMKMFSQGDLNTPLLHKVQLQQWGKKERWEGNLNSTVQQLFKERNAMAREDEEYEDEILEEHQGNPSTSNTQRKCRIT
ncbi:uncharacterized protein LOC111277046 isoform X2 [Durio zibethinus]|uniref:Uncharacterized protein LOC111277046 isoform X2 n=1 Tax=Durio zibethinus TaxID=66656 RepID=A0A6P5WSY3_DURZI|nr:uncharacterized protein LOC111277046 isoform X2 [Durio zibethinus]